MGCTSQEKAFIKQRCLLISWQACGHVQTAAGLQHGRYIYTHFFVRLSLAQVGHSVQIVFSLLQVCMGFAADSWKDSPSFEWNLSRALWSAV